MLLTYSANYNGSLEAVDCQIHSLKNDRNTISISELTGILGRITCRVSAVALTTLLVGEVDKLRVTEAIYG